MSLRNVSRILVQTFYRPQVGLSYARSYGRWMHRQPAKVILPFEPTSTSLKKDNIIDLDPEQMQKSRVQHAESLKSSSKNSEVQKGSSKSRKLNNLKTQTLCKQTFTETSTQNNENTNVNSEWSLKKSQSIRAEREEKINKLKLSLRQAKVFDDNNEIIYEKCKENDGRISSLLVKLKNKKGRQKSGQILVEGWRLIVDGLEAKCQLKYVIFSRTEDLNKIKPLLPTMGVRIYKIPYKEIELWSDLETSPGIFGIFETPTPDEIKKTSKPFPMQIICDNIRVPGNLGAILRAAVGVGCQKVILTQGCVDLWDPKVLRSGAGAHFRLPVHVGVDWDHLPEFVSDGSSVFIADSNAKMQSGEEDTEPNKEDGVVVDGYQMPVLPYYAVEYSKLKFITVIIGGETEGISEDSYRFAASRNGLRLNIPLQNGVDSLNTGMAAAVIAFEIKKQLIQAWTKIKMESQGVTI